MKLDLSNVEFSKIDINKKRLKIPTHLTPELAEFLGFHMGDGHMSIYRNKKSITYRVESFSNLHKEIEYIDNHILPLIQKLFNITPIPVKHFADSTYIVRTYSKGLVTFLNSLEIPLGAKHGYRIPKIIRNNKEFIPHFLRGLADADFSFCLKRRGNKLYPVINTNSSNTKLIEDISLCLKELDINHCSCFNFKYIDKRFNSERITNFIDINGIKNVSKWLEIIGFNNPYKKEVTQRFINLKNKRLGEDSNSAAERTNLLCVLGPYG